MSRIGWAASPRWGQTPVDSSSRRPPGAIAVTRPSKVAATSPAGGCRSTTANGERAGARHGAGQRQAGQAAAEDDQVEPLLLLLAFAHHVLSRGPAR
jgi:hypothetical protein